MILVWKLDRAFRSVAHRRRTPRRISRYLFDPGCQNTAWSREIWVKVGILAGGWGLPARTPWGGSKRQPRASWRSPGDAADRRTTTERLRRIQRARRGRKCSRMRSGAASGARGARGAPGILQQGLNAVLDAGICGLIGPCPWGHDRPHRGRRDSSGRNLYAWRGAFIVR